MTANAPISICLWGLSVLLCLSAEGQQTWSHGGGDARWFTPANWSGSFVPRGSDDVHLNANSTPLQPVTIDDPATAYVNTLKVGNSAGDAGYLEVHTDLSCSNDLYVADVGTGVVAHVGGVVTVADNMLIGEGSGGFGRYELRGAASELRVTNTMYVARYGGAVGALTVRDGLVRIDNDLTVNDAGSATLSLLGGVVTVADRIEIGAGDVVTQTACRVTAGEISIGGVGGAANWQVDASNAVISVGNLYVAQAATSEGSLWLTRGTVSAPSNALTIAAHVSATGIVCLAGGVVDVDDLILGPGLGTLLHSNGTVNVRDQVNIGFSDPVPSVYRMLGSNAVLTVSNSMTIGRLDGSANALFDQQAGSVTLAGSLYVGSATQSYLSTNHTYRLAGGTLTISNDLYVGYTGGEGRFVHTGGHLEVADDCYVARSGNNSYRWPSEYRISGDASLNVAGLLDIGSSDAMTYQVTGTLHLATSHSGTIECQGWTQRAQGRGVLAVTVDSPTCLPVAVRGDLRFESGSLLDVIAVDGAAPGSYVIIECAGTLIDSGLQFAPGVDTRAWSFSTAGNQLVITYAPPPPAGSVFIVH